MRAPFLAFEIGEEVGIGNVGFVGGIIEIVVKDAL